ncbi:uncharacterized protein A4U43_C02F20260 [Asparagus officinalis]|uniref:Uncharacterized protein n=1 Tax=Asparagus officinalis TaxID=4686 RepID=A0A5P1FJN8_ASPOF|nr:uncharacterized protein A4U43_C02F20260 [Asparagus officinalis]
MFMLSNGSFIKEGAPFWVVYDENSPSFDEAVHFLPAIWRQPVGNLYHDDDDDAIAAFDLKKEEWSKLPLPDIRHFSRDLDGVLRLSPEAAGRIAVHGVLGLVESRSVAAGGGRDSSCASWVKVYSIDRCCYPHHRSASSTRRRTEGRCWRGPTASCRSTTQRRAS